ncbi:MAG: ATP-binding cassette domain-containing protein [Planctomycetes bacterium]|nr:ATP-binding cassette domain-containing protein [Planctomycetota bacterium]
MNALTIRDLRKTYRNGVEALKGVDLDVRAGEFFGLLGPNGAGKSTTIGIVTSLINKTGGTVEVFGIDLDRDPAGVKQLIGVVPQEFNFNMFEKVGQIVQQQAGYYGLPRKLARQRAEHYLKKMGLWDKRHDSARQLSGGMKRRLMIARAMVHEPKLMILDEPTAGVDIELRRSTWALMQEVNRNGTAVILTTHYLEEAESLCRQIAIIDRGVIVENTDKKSLLAKLHVETFIFDLAHTAPANLDLNGYPYRLTDPHTLEIDVSKEQALNDVFARLSAQGVSVLSMRNKANRLEELFVRMVEKNNV